MAITVQHKKEALGQAYIRAVIAKACYNIGKSDWDYGFDGTIKDVIDRGGRYVENGFGLDFQLKSSCDVDFQDGKVIYNLESKNYNDLATESTMLPHILVLYVLPANEHDWLNVSYEDLTMKKCAWWYSLEGQPFTDNTSTKRIAIPYTQVFSPETLIELIEKVKGGQKL